MKTSERFVYCCEHVIDEDDLLRGGGQAEANADVVEVVLGRHRRYCKESLAVCSAGR